MRILGLLLLLAASAAAKEAVQFRLEKEPKEFVRGWALEANREGFRFERFGTGRRLWVPWDALVYEDARRLRIHFEIDWIEHAKPEIVAGHRLVLKGGGAVEGLLVSVDEKGRHWLRTDGMLLPYPGDRIQRVEEIELPETQIWNKHEIYLRRLQRRPPTTPAEHRELGDYMFDIGNWARAVEHYEAAIARRAAWASDLQPRVAEIRDIQADERASKAFAKAKSWAFLHGDYRKAKGIVERYIEKYPDAKRRGFLVLDQIEEQRERRLRSRFHRVKHEEFDRAVRKFLLTRKPTLAAALEWLQGEMENKLAKRVRRRLELDAEEYERFKKTKARGAPHFATYWSGTHIIAKRGKSKKMDPETWWGAYESNTRASWLKAYAAEHFPQLFEVVDVRFTDCERCGGRGLVRKLNLNPRGNQPAEYKETCPRCQGVGQDRGVAYR